MISSASLLLLQSFANLLKMTLFPSNLREMARSAEQLWLQLYFLFCFLCRKTHRDITLWCVMLWGGFAQCWELSNSCCRVDLSITFCLFFFFLLFNRLVMFKRWGLTFLQTECRDTIFLEEEANVCIKLTLVFFRHYLQLWTIVPLQ